MMQNLVPGFQLTDNLLLTEELPVPPLATYRVWYALNVQKGKIVVIKIHPDNRIEDMAGDVPPKDKKNKGWGQQVQVTDPSWQKSGSAPNSWAVGPVPPDQFQSRQAGIHGGSPVNLSRQRARRKRRFWAGLAAIILSGILLGAGAWYWVYFDHTDKDKLANPTTGGPKGDSAAIEKPPARWRPVGAEEQEVSVDTTATVVNPNVSDTSSVASQPNSPLFFYDTLPVKPAKPKVYQKSKRKKSSDTGGYVNDQNL